MRGFALVFKELPSRLHIDKTLAARFFFPTLKSNFAFAEEARVAGLKTDINKCKQLWPWDVIKKNSMSRPHKTITYCYFQAAGVIARERSDDIHQFGVLLENVDGVLGRCK